VVVARRRDRDARRRDRGGDPELLGQLAVQRDLGLLVGMDEAAGEVPLVAAR
jgi:hypothetical protein